MRARAILYRTICRCGMLRWMRSSHAGRYLFSTTSASPGTRRWLPLLPIAIHFGVPPSLVRVVSAVSEKSRPDCGIELLPVESERGALSRMGPKKMPPVRQQPLIYQRRFLYHTPLGSHTMV